MRRIHLISGVVTIIAFLGSGAYLMFAVPQSWLDPERHLIYVSRHIYMLGPALVNLLLAVYASPNSFSRIRRLQWAGTVLLVIASILLMLSFVTEPIGNRGRTIVSALGLFSLWAGAFFHILAPGMARIPLFSGKDPEL